MLSDPLGNLPAYDAARDRNRFLMLELTGRVGVVHLLARLAERRSFRPDTD